MDDKDTAELVRVVKDLSARVQTLEANSPPESVEFEVQFSTGSSETLQHGFGCPVRWWVTDWAAGENGVSPMGMSMYRSASDNNSITIFSAYEGKAVIRVEKSQFGVL
jgi:hypothetical protein